MPIPTHPATDRTRGEDGASTVEYGLLLGGIAAVIVAALFLFGTMTSDLYDQACGVIEHEGQFGMPCSESAG